jgi:formiminotetrahydrofolate cyclodeaminase
MSMIAGYREQAKLAGLMIEKKQVDVNVKHISEEDLAEMSEDELNQLIDKADAIELTHAEYERLPEG